LLGRASGAHLWAIEGPINGAGPALDRFGSAPTALPARDPAPEGFAIPDLAGLAAPHWRPDIGLEFSASAQALDPHGRRRVVLEGLVFRVREVLEWLTAGRLPQRVFLSGGLTRDPAVAPALAAALGRPVEVLDEIEGILLGVARLAAGLDPCATPVTTEVAPGDSGAYLTGKYPYWRAWLARRIRD
jgi:sugar (pentulose or hexulose) kinase